MSTTCAPSPCTKAADCNAVCRYTIPALRFRVGLSALIYAEYLRDNMQKEVLFVMDNIFRFVQAGSELSSLLGRMPATVGYQPTLNTEEAELHTLQQRERLVSVTAVYHNDEGAIVTRQLLPPFTHGLPQPAGFAYPPVLNEPPQDFLGGLTDQYLLAVLHEILYTSLMAENQQRVAHLEDAVSHLDEASADLKRQCNTLRQGEIIEEIEVILLNSANLGGNPQEAQSDRKDQYRRDFF